VALGHSSTRQSPRKHKTSAPCLIVYGFYDELAGSQKIMQGRLTGAKSVTLHEFKNSSHLPNVEETETYNGKPLASPTDEHARLTMAA